MRTDLGGGHWFEHRDRLTWAERNRVRDATGDGEGFFQGFATTLCKVYVTAWDVPGGLALDDAGWQALDADTGDAIFRIVLDAWKGQPSPKDTAATSSST